MYCSCVVCLVENINLAQLNSKGQFNGLIGCEDVDDTLSIRPLTNGNVELGVHIADVTHFLRPGSLTDLEARRRATTVYLADRR